MSTRRTDESMCLARGLAYGTAPPGLLLEVKRTGSVGSDALCENQILHKAQRKTEFIYLVGEKNTDALRCERRQKPSL